MPTVYTPLIGQAAASAVASGTYVQTAAVADVPATPAATLFYNVVDYGAAVAHSAAANKAAIDLAIAAASADGGGIIWFPVGTFQTTGGHVLGSNTQVWGAGVTASIIQHTGNNVCFSQLTNDLLARRGFRDLKIEGNAGASAKGIELGNCYFPLFLSVQAEDYTNGVGIEIHNSAQWTEGVTMIAVHTRNCLRGFRFRKSGAGTNSLSELRMLGCNAVIDVASGIGVDFDDGMFVYGGQINLKFNAEVATAICINVGTGTNVSDNLLSLYAESTAGGAKFIKTASGAKVVGVGMVANGANIVHDLHAASTVSIAPSLAALPNTIGGTVANWRGTGNSAQVIPAVVYDEDLPLGGFGVAGGNNVISPVIWMYSVAGNAFEVRKVDFGSNAAAGTILLTVDTSGNIISAGYLAVSQSASAPVITNDTTIDTTIGVARVAPGGAVTGIILEAGVAAGQELWVVNQSAAASTVTMAAAGTSNVADGVGTVIAGLAAAKFVWNSSTSLWYRS